MPGPPVGWLFLTVLGGLLTALEQIQGATKHSPSQGLLCPLTWNEALQGVPKPANTLLLPSGQQETPLCLKAGSVL